MQPTPGYTIKKLVPSHLFNRALFRQLAMIGEEVSRTHGSKLNWTNFQIFDFAEHHHLVACFKDDDVIGVLLCHLGRSILDPSVTFCYQDLLFAKSPRAFKMLMDEFVDFGKANANHLISMIGSGTNLKQESMEKLGFHKVEEMYRLEV